MGLELNINFGGRAALFLLLSIVCGCSQAQQNPKYVISGVDRHGCAMFRPANAGTYVAVMIWKTIDGKYTSTFPGKNGCEKAVLPPKGKHELMRPD